MSFNKITLVGYLGRDPELRYTPQGTAVCNFSIATNDRKKDKSGEFQDITTWFRVTLWDKKAETASKYLTKGSQIYIEGRLRVEEWQDRDGKDRYTLEVQGSDMQFIGSGSGGGRSDEYSEDSPREAEHSGPPAASEGGKAQAAPAGDDDIPF